MFLPLFALSFVCGQVLSAPTPDSVVSAETTLPTKITDMESDEVPSQHQKITLGLGKCFYIVTRETYTVDCPDTGFKLSIPVETPQTTTQSPVTSSSTVSLTQRICKQFADGNFNRETPYFCASSRVTDSPPDPDSPLDEEQDGDEEW